MRVPPIRVLLPIFISENRLKRSSMQVEVEHIRGKKSRGGKRTDKQLIDGAVTLDANFGGRGGSGMGGDHQAQAGSSWRQRNMLAIVKRTGHPTFWMDA